MPIEWAIRSSALVLAASLLLRLLRVKDPAAALAAWIATLLASFSIRAIMAVPARTHSSPIAGLWIPEGPEIHDLQAPPHAFNWVLAIYFGVAAVLAVRLITALAMSHGLRRASRVTGRGFRESDAIGAPIAVGILKPEILLPADWSDWEPAKLDAVLAHERSHIRRRDPAIQAISAFHRAILWFTPFAWLLHSRIVRLAEQASDDAALATAPDRAFYAGMLLHFMQRSGGGHRWAGQAMARYGKVEDRIHRVLENGALSRGITKPVLVMTVLFAAPLTYLAGQVRGVHTAPRQPAANPTAEAASGAFSHLGSVKAATVVVRPRVEGDLRSVSFREGQMVKQGQILATIDTRQGSIDVRSPMDGLAGLQMIDPGNEVNPGSSIVVIARLQPISVVFTAPEDQIRQLRALAQSQATVEAWNRGNSVRLATGKLAGMDSTIDEQTGTVRLKAVFANSDGALFPNQFVNVKVVP